MAVKKGDTIRVDYTGTLEDGAVFDASEKHGKPLEFEVGAGMLIKGFDEAVVGMEPGDEKEVKLQPDEAYGQPRDEMVQKVPKDKMPEGQEVKEGMMLMIALPNGMQLPAKVVKIEGNDVTIDANHPLAGKALNFKIKVNEIVPAEEVAKAKEAAAAAGSECCGGDCGDKECGDDCCTDDKEDKEENENKEKEQKPEEKPAQEPESVDKSEEKKE